MKLPYIAIKKQVIFPYSTDSIKVGKARSVEAFEYAKNNNPKATRLVIVFLNENADNSNKISLKDIYQNGVLATVTKSSKKNSIWNIELKANELVKIKSFNTDVSFEDEPLLVEYEHVKLKNDLKALESYRNQLNVLATKAKSSKVIPEDPMQYVPQSTSAITFIENLTNAEYDDVEKHDVNTWRIIEQIQGDLTLADKYKLIDNLDIAKRYETIIEKLSTKINLNKIENEINNTMRGDLEEQQRDFLLREKMRQIKKMLKEDDSSKELEKILKDSERAKQFPKYVLDTIQSEQARMASMMPSSPEANTAKTYIDLLLAMPWRKVSKEILDIENVRKVLDKHHYGLQKPKERILEFISVLTHTQAKEPENTYLPIKDDPENFIDTKLFINKSGTVTNEAVNNIPILTLIGPPGVGKTTLAKSIAEALNRKFIKVSLGGVKDEAEIRGHRRTYVGALPGKIITAIKKAGVSNPVILLDEIDKMSADFRGDPVSAMLEVLDPEQNTNFQDHYLDLEYDLSKVLFIATANYYDSIPAPLIDRVELLELSTYTTIEKLQIAKTHLMPKILSQNKLTEKQFQIKDDVIEFIIRNYTRESGVRELKRLLDTIARKIVVKILDKKVKDEFVVTKDIAKEFLGPIRFKEDENENIAQVGVVNGLAYTSYGGSTLAIEVTTFPGKDGLRLTGSLKDVMKESAQIALAYVRHNAKKFDIDFDFDNNSIHIHVPEGAVPKDGPSAGVTFTTSIISALSHKPVPANIGMTGEITLRGKVLPIGGLKEKSLAAAQFGIKKIFIPYDNERNLIDVPEEVKKEVKFIPVKYYDEIYEAIFKGKPSK